jgi:hypothetical protein
MQPQTFGVKFRVIGTLNTSEFIIMINSRHILNLSIELIIKPQALDNTSCYKCNSTIFKIFKKIVFKKVLKKF